MIKSKTFFYAGITCLMLSGFSPTKQNNGITVHQAQVTQYGTIQGTLIYPSDVLPSQKICAENVANRNEYCTQTREEQTSYTLQVPLGIYHIFALECSEYYGEKVFCQDRYLDERAYYNEYVKCGLTARCRCTNRPISVTVKPGEIVKGVNPHDWYCRYNSILYYGSSKT